MTEPDERAEGRARSICDLDDDELVRRLQRDDLDAFEVLFDRHRVAIFRTAFGLTGDRLVAEEILQDTFARAYLRRSALKTDVSPAPWLHRVAINLCYSRLGRRRLPAGPIEEAECRPTGDGRAEPVERAERAELRRIVREGVAMLPEKQQAVVVLYYLQGLSLQETSAALGVCLGTVKSRLHYALRGLRLRLEEDRRFGGAYAPLLAASAVQDPRP